MKNIFLISFVVLLIGNVLGQNPKITFTQIKPVDVQKIVASSKERRLESDLVGKRKCALVFLNVEISQIK